MVGDCPKDDGCLRINGLVYRMLTLLFLIGKPYIEVNRYYFPDWNRNHYLEIAFGELGKLFAPMPELPRRVRILLLS
jgi:hypothetical protein